MSIKGIFEIAPTDFPLPTGTGGTQYLNADGTAFNVLLGMCDGDVWNLQGVRSFDRMMAYTGAYTGIPADNPERQKSTFTVWGANHNFFNSEWQLLDGLLNSSGTGCVGARKRSNFLKSAIRRKWFSKPTKRSSG